MTATDATKEPRHRREQSDAERTQIEAAMARLLARPRAQGDAPPSVSELARVAGVKRWVLTHKHIDLKDRFQADVARAHVAPTNAHLAEDAPRVQRLQDQIARLRHTNTELRGLVNFYANALNEVSMEYEALAAQRGEPSNVLPLDTRRQLKEQSRSGRDRMAGEQFTPGVDTGDQEGR
jgi:hypothetical protein